jgi:hypothetical protein
MKTRLAACLIMILGAALPVGQVVPADAARYRGDDACAKIMEAFSSNASVTAASYVGPQGCNGPINVPAWSTLILPSTVVLQPTSFSWGPGSRIIGAGQSSIIKPTTSGVHVGAATGVGFCPTNAALEGNDDAKSRQADPQQGLF